MGVVTMASAAQSPDSKPLPLVLDLDRFLVWLADVILAERDITPTDRFGDDLGLDDFAVLGVVTAVDQLLAHEGWVRSDVYREIRTVRDLYLSYLAAVSMPLEPIDGT
jgi:hypothetical protein